MKHQIRYFYLLAVTSTFLSGCGANKHQQTSLLPLIIKPTERVALDNRYVIAAVQDYLKQKHAPPFSQYDFMRVDLDKDGWQDALIYITTPYGKWCDINGCTLLVLQAKEDKFIPAGEIFSLRSPFYISDTLSEGWRNIIVRVSGRTEKAKNVVLRFDGTEYHGNVATLPAERTMLHPVYARAFP
ncbi:MAG: hypothetical protein COB14_01025 [Alphaproteobacteria bacterium]|nr:MAG: hypothetical protein COB14_01025 [Alphaproteobacteria bacterium]